MRSNKGKSTGGGIGGALGTVLGGFFGPLGSALGGAAVTAAGTGIGSAFDGDDTDRFNLPGSTAIAKDNASAVLRDLNESPGLSAGTVSRAQESMNRDALKGTQRLNTRLNMGGMSDLAKERMIRGFEDNFTKLSVELDSKLIDEGIRQERANLDSKAKAGAQLANIGRQETGLDLQNAREEDARKAETSNMFKGMLGQAAGATGLDFKMPDFGNSGGENLGTDAEINAMPTLPTSEFEESILDGTFAELEKSMTLARKEGLTVDEQVELDTEFAPLWHEGEADLFSLDSFDDNDYGEMGLSLIDNAIDGLGIVDAKDVGENIAGLESLDKTYQDFASGKRKKLNLTSEQKRMARSMGLGTSKNDIKATTAKLQELTEESRTKQSILDELNEAMGDIDQGLFGGAQ